MQTKAMGWDPSPAVGVWRKSLEREGVESGRATSVVRYAPGSSFASHVHDRGEEIFVLDGTFEDEDGATKRAPISATNPHRATYPAVRW